MTDQLEKTNRTRLRRANQRGSHDRVTINAILDAQPLCHVGYAIEGKPMVTPTFQWREGDHVYWHGSSASRALRASEGADVCLTVSILDGFVMARSGFHHSANYRAAMLFGKAEPVQDADKNERVNAFIEALWPGRSAVLRPNTDQELKATTILSMPIAEASAKIRTGPPADDEEDYELPIWAGVIPVTTQSGPLQADPRNREDVSPPAHLSEFDWRP